MATRIANADFVDALADMAGVTQTDTEKVLKALGPTISSLFKKTGQQMLELGGFAVLEEQRKTGKLAPELGGASYDVPFISVRISDVIKDAIKIRSNKLLADGSQSLLSDEEYLAAENDQFGQVQ